MRWAFGSNELERQVGRHQRALAVIEALFPSDNSPTAALRRADCLVALGRQDDAISVLVNALPYQRPNGSVQERLDELLEGASPVKG